jgi:hypothetical protein
MEMVMSSNQKSRAPTELWSLEQAVVWIETRADLPQHLIYRWVAPATLQEVYQALKAGMITASGCVDGSERRDISPEEWPDYRLELKHTKFLSHYFTGSAETPIIAVLSIRSFPTTALKYHGYPSGVRIPSASAHDGDPGYHRVITDVRLRCEQVIKQWPGNGWVSPPQDRLPERAKSRPAFDRAQRVIGEVYPGGIPDQATLPNASLCQRVGAKLKEAKLPDVSNDTILRAAGRRK